MTGFYGALGKEVTLTVFIKAFMLPCVIQIQRHENGSIQPALDVLRRLVVALSVSADMLVFDRNERRPDEDLKLTFEA